MLRNFAFAAAAAVAAFVSASTSRIRHGELPLGLDSDLPSDLVHGPNHAPGLQLRALGMRNR